MKAMTLRLPDAVHESLRQQAFDERTSVNALIVKALTPAGVGGCDVCGAPRTVVTTPGAIRLCDTHRPKPGGSE